MSGKETLTVIRRASRWATIRPTSRSKSLPRSANCGSWSRAKSWCVFNFQANPSSLT